jgi:hypothetical protein
MGLGVHLREKVSEAQVKVHPDEWWYECEEMEEQTASEKCIGSAAVTVLPEEMSACDRWLEEEVCAPTSSLLYCTSCTIVLNERTKKERRTSEMQKSISRPGISCCRFIWSPASSTGDTVFITFQLRANSPSGHANPESSLCVSFDLWIKEEADGIRETPLWSYESTDSSHQTFDDWLS